MKRKRRRSESESKSSLLRKLERSEQDASRYWSMASKALVKCETMEFRMARIRDTKADADKYRVVRLLLRQAIDETNRELGITDAHYEHPFKELIAAIGV